MPESPSEIIKIIDEIGTFKFENTLDLLPSIIEDLFVFENPFETPKNTASINGEITPEIDLNSLFGLIPNLIGLMEFLILALMQTTLIIKHILVYLSQLKE